MDADDVTTIVVSKLMDNVTEAKLRYILKREGEVKSIDMDITNGEARVTFEKEEGKKF